MPSATQAALLALFGATAFLAADARQEYVAKLPNGAKVPGVKALGHTDPNGGGDTNNFGNAFDSAGLKWTTAFCNADSDGDGQTNGQELGDPCCAWVQGSNPVVLWTDGVSHPGDASKTSNSSLWTTITCNTTAASATTSSGAGGASAISFVGLLGGAVVLALSAILHDPTRMLQLDTWIEARGCPVFKVDDMRPPRLFMSTESFDQTHVVQSWLEESAPLAQKQPSVSLRLAVPNMRSAVQTTALLALLLLASSCLYADARKEYVAKLPNGAKVPGVKALGHTDPNGGGDTNEFGRSFEYTGLVWSSVFCHADSDGDGQTNGQELGDPCCEWVQDTNPVVLWTDGVSHPGDAAKKSDESLWANITCNKSSLATVTASSRAESSRASAAWLLLTSLLIGLVLLAAN